MTLELKALYSSEVDLWSWEPASLADVYFLLELEIGEAGDKRKDLFYVTIATPEGLRANARGREIIASRALFVVSEYSLNVLKLAISERVAACESSTWQESCSKLQRHFRWEYEDYTVEEP